MTDSGPGTPAPSGTSTPSPSDSSTASPSGGSVASPIGTPAPSRKGRGQVPALQPALAAEHAVIWGYATVGAHAGDALLPAVRAADDDHRTRRDATITLIARYGGTPVPTAPEYALPFPITDRASALRLAVHLEEGAAAAWRYTVAATDDVDVRRTALTALSDAAVQATRWRQLEPTSPLTVAFPGG